MSNPNPQFAISVHPGELHFSAAHFITFDHSCENLHGHNFHVRIQAWGGNNSDAFVIDFVQLTRLAATICHQLDGSVLLPGSSREVDLVEKNGQIEISSYDKHFSLPAGNCRILPIANATAEMLAWYLMETLIPLLNEHTSLANVETLELAVEEADQQWGICRRHIQSGQS